MILTSSSIAFAKSNHNGGKENNKKYAQEQEKESKKKKVKKQEFKLKDSPVIKYGRYQLPIKPVTKGMGAKLTYKKDIAEITVEKGSILIGINLKNKIIKVNGVEDTKSGIFTASNSKKKTVLIKYIAKTLGVRVEVDEDEVIVEVPVGLSAPTNVIVTPVGPTVINNTLNNATLFMTATATITIGQATGGKAELYVGSKLVATDSVITATDTTVTFTTADDTPTNDELKAIVPEGGVVTVKLYNASNQYVTSKEGNPTLVVDYVAPSITSISSAMYYPAQNKLYLIVTGVNGMNDKVDVTKLSFYDTARGVTYQLTNTIGTGSVGSVNSANSIMIDLGTMDRLSVASFGPTTTILNIAVGSLLTDAAGNTSAEFTTVQSVPVTVIN